MSKILRSSWRLRLSGRASSSKILALCEGRSRTTTAPRGLGRQYYPGRRSLAQIFQSVAIEPCGIHFNIGDALFDVQFSG